MGSNDFRSTKRNVRWAGIHGPAGLGILVDGGERKAVRAAVETDRISVHLLDWYGGTGAGLREWTDNYGDGKPVKVGERIESKLGIALGKFAGGRGR